MKMQKRLMPVFVLAIVLSAASNSFAAIYKYIDKNGIICFSDDLQSIPEQCRSTATIVSGKQEEESKPALQKQPPVQAEAKPGAGTSSFYREKASIDGTIKSLYSSRVLISVIVVVSGLFAFVILGILDADHKKSIRIVRLVIGWGMSVYLIVAHTGDVVHVFRTLDGKIDTVRQESEEKGKKAAKAMKEMDAFMQHVDTAGSQDSGGIDQEKRE